MIQFHCQCGKLLQASEDLAGRLTRCPACEAEFSIPPTSAPAEAEEAVSSPQSKQDGFPDDDMEDYDDAPRPRGNGRSGKAIVSLMLGISSFVFVFFTGIPAIVMGIVALRDIKAGEELTFNYGYELDEEREQPCTCGAEHCCGFILAPQYWGVVKNWHETC